jgi:hypothetical protein
MKILLAPLHKIAKITEDSKEVLATISLLTTDLKNIALFSAKELAKHTVLLTNIRDLIKEQTSKKEKTEKEKKIKMPSFIGIAKGALVIVSMAAAIVAATSILSIMPTISVGQLVTAIAVAGLFVVLTPVFLAITAAFARSGGRLILDKITGNSMGAGSIKGIMQMVGVGGAAMISMASAVVASAWILQMLPAGGISGAQFITAIAVGFIMMPLSYAIAGVMIGLRSSGLTFDKKSLKKLLIVPFIIAAMATGLVAAAWIFKMLPSDMTMIPIGPIISISLAILAFSFAFVMLEKATRRISTKQLLIIGLAIPVIVLSMVAAAHIFNMLPDAYKSPPLKWVGKAALSLIIMAIPFVLIATFARISKLDRKGLIRALMTVTAIAASLLAVAWIFSILPDTFVPIPTDWLISAGIGLVAFGIPFILIAKFGSSISPKAMAMAGLMMVSIAITVLAVAWIFSVMPGTFAGPTLEWSIATALGIGAFAVPFLIIGAIATTGVGAAAIGLGAAGMILIAGTMWVIAWIFSKMPDVGNAMDGFTKAILAPFNGMVDIFTRLKNEIGVGNLASMGLGLISLATGWLALTAALAGSAAGGLIGSVANLGSSIIDGISGLFGGKKTKTPIELLDALLTRGPAIKLLAIPMQQFGLAFASIANHTESVVTGLGAFSIFMDEDNSDRLGKSATSAEKIAKAYGSIAMSSNNMDVGAINASSRMFEAIARIAENDGEDAITALAKQLLEAVDKLGETVEKLDSTVGTQESGMTDALSGIMGSFIDKIKGTNKEVGDSSETGLVDIQPIVEAIQELEERFMRPIRVQEV